MEQGWKQVWPQFTEYSASFIDIQGLVQNEWGRLTFINLLKKLKFTDFRKFSPMNGSRTIRWNFEKKKDGRSIQI